MKKKVLIITYYWPPSGGPGVQRVLNFAKYLPKYGWEPVILTVRKGEYPAKDPSLEKEIPSHLKVYKTKTFEPFSIFKPAKRRTTQSVPIFSPRKARTSSPASPNGFGSTSSSPMPVSAGNVTP